MNQPRSLKQALELYRKGMVYDINSSGPTYGDNFYIGKGVKVTGARFEGNKILLTGYLKEWAGEDEDAAGPYVDVGIGGTRFEIEPRHLHPKAVW